MYDRYREIKMILFSFSTEQMGGGRGARKIRLRVANLFRIDGKFEIVRLKKKRNAKC